MTNAARRRRPTCIVYVRLSRSDDYSTSIQSQVDACRAFADAQGWDVLFVADQDNGVSGGRASCTTGPVWRACSLPCPTLSAPPDPGPSVAVLAPPVPAEAAPDTGQVMTSDRTLRSARRTAGRTLWPPRRPLSMSARSSLS
jgi:hypothetical protein